MLTRCCLFLLLALATSGCAKEAGTSAPTTTVETQHSSTTATSLATTTSIVITEVQRTGLIEDCLADLSDVATCSDFTDRFMDMLTNKGCDFEQIRGILRDMRAAIEVGGDGVRVAGQAKC